MKMLYLYLDLSNKKYSIATSSITPTFDKSFSFANGVYSVPELATEIFSDDALLCVYAKDTWEHDYNLVISGQYLSGHGLAQLGKYAPNPVFLRFVENGLAFDNTSVFVGGYGQSPLDTDKLLEPLQNIYGEYLSTLEVSSVSDVLDALFAKIALDKNSISVGDSSGSSDSFNFRNLDGHLTLIPNGARVFVSGFSSDQFIVQKSYLVENSVNSFSIYFDLIKDGKVLTIPYTSLAGLVKDS
ncbi:hypothetical protein [Wolinella succinogenes]|uniref:hypothetical protein n=1 Tax=Wolinella succinogenes TaxID=844 RepID=UPI002FC721EB